MGDTSNPVYFLHVGKSGGTSVDDLLTRLFKCANRSYVGGEHYDWSYVRRRELLRRRGKDNGHSLSPEEDDYDDGEGRGYEATITYATTLDADVITFLRHPASRATSQFRFSKSLRWAIESNATFIRQTFDEYLDDEEHRTWTQPIADGESGTDFLPGIFPPGGWVRTDGMENIVKERLRANRTGTILLAAERLEATTWYGLMEDVGRSMELLDASLDLELRRERGARRSVLVREQRREEGVAASPEGPPARRLRKPPAPIRGVAPLERHHGADLLGGLPLLRGRPLPPSSSTSNGGGLVGWGVVFPRPPTKSIAMQQRSNGSNRGTTSDIMSGS